VCDVWNSSHFLFRLLQTCLRVHAAFQQFLDCIAKAVDVLSKRRSVSIDRLSVENQGENRSRSVSFKGRIAWREARFTIDHALSVGRKSLPLVAVVTGQRFRACLLSGLDTVDARHNIYVQVTQVPCPLQTLRARRTRANAKASTSTSFRWASSSRWWKRHASSSTARTRRPCTGRRSTRSTKSSTRARSASSTSTRR